MMKTLTFCLILFSLQLHGQLNDLMITEYVDWNPGSGWAIKVYNPGPNVKILSNYYVQVFNNNSTTASSSFQLSGTLAAGNSIIISNANNNQASADFKACFDDLRTNALGVNDNDCIALSLGNGNNFVDMIGLYGQAVKNRVAGISNALEHQKLIRQSGNCIRYSSTDGSSANSWPSSSSVSLGGWTVNPPTCLSSTNSFSPFGAASVRNENICDGDSVLFAGSYFSVAGSYYDTNFAGGGCGQIQQLNLAVMNSPRRQLAIELCRGDSFFYANNWLYTDTLFIQTKASATSCDSIIETSLEFRGPTASFDWIYSNQDSNSIQIQNHNSSSSESFHWDFGDGNISTDVNPIHYYESGGTYLLKLVISDQNGCSDSISKSVFIPNSDFSPPILPNVFSPNGDLINDRYYLNFQKAPSDFSVNIFNRHGQLMFSSSDPNFSWDGNHKGQACTNGTYYVIVNWDKEILKNFLSLQR